MQSPTQQNSHPNPVTTETTKLQLDTQPEDLPAQSQPEAQEAENKSDAQAETETAFIPQENGTEVQTAETPADEAGTEAELKETAQKPSAPTEPAPEKTTNPHCDGKKSEKKDQGVRDGRKYVPSKKAMIDPLKMDMSKPLVMPLTSSELSLQCLECHIIFSDHKSKERHLKLSHPAQYEQCILRNALFACYVCDRHFTNSTELMAHQKAHIERKPFRCPICGQAFNKSSQLTLHKKIHLGQDGYPCTDCGKACKTMTLLKYHRRIHTGERPYICRECGRRFTMPKALQKHALSHLPEGAEGEGGEISDKAQEKKDDGTKYPCSVCKATFKSTKTRLHHMKTKHAEAGKALPVGHQVKQSTPIITPISISQPALLQLGANGPLQKVDANIDTEQIRRLIESLANVQKVNQVVILGQVPPHAPPLEVQQISQVTETTNLNLNLNPPQIDFMGFKDPESKTNEFNLSNNHCDPMEQTIILEPITPDGQLENPPFPELASHIPVSENIELTLVQTEQTERTEGDGIQNILQQPDISAVHGNDMNQLLCENGENLEQTVILELTPALIPTMVLEQSQTVPQNEMLGSTTATTELGFPQVDGEMVVDETGTSLSVQPLTVELELAPLQEGQQDLASCSAIPPDPQPQPPSESDTHPKEEFDTRMQNISQDQVDPGLNKAEEMQEKDEPELSHSLPVESLEDQKKMENLSAKEDPSSKESTSSEAKRVSQISELPVNVMSAQELVKVRKRKPARAFFLQGYMQETAGSVYKDDFQIDTTPAKRQRTKKSHLIVKFGPQSKDKKNKKQKKPTQQHRSTQEEVIRGKMPATNLSKKKVESQKKEKKGKKDKTAGHLKSKAEVKSPSSIQEPKFKQNKEYTTKNKVKKKKEVARAEKNIISSKQKSVASSVSKKKQVKMMQRDQPRNAKDGKQKKNLARKEKEKTKTSAAPADVIVQHVMEDSLLLLKGHKQPQLKVYKLDPSQASGNSQETQESTKLSRHCKDNELKQPASSPTKNITSQGKKKGGRPKKTQKALLLLSSLKVSRETPETLPAKPKAPRKRKASSKVETEGIITSSKRGLECKDCGEKFSEVSSLQKHKTMVHIVESPGLTYTNGNIFEGVSRLDLYHLPKQHDKAVGLDWDTEPEMGESALEDRERNVSFPSLIPSPSLPVHPSDIEMNAYDDKIGSTTKIDDELPPDQIENSVTHPDIPSESPLSPSALTKTSETREPLASDEDKQEEGSSKNPSMESEVQSTMVEDSKDDILFEVDLVTVGDQNERQDPASTGDTVVLQDLQGSNISEVDGSDKLSVQVNNETTEKTLTSQTVSCSTHQTEIKEEEEEVLVQKKKGGKGTVMRNGKKSKRKATGPLNSDLVSKRAADGDAVRGSESEKEQDDCHLLYEKHPITSNPEIIDESGTNPEYEANSETAFMLCSSKECPEKQVMLEPESATTFVAMNEKEMQTEDESNRGQSPGIILERVLTSTPRVIADKELCRKTTSNNQRQGLGRNAENERQVLRSQEIKVEEIILDPLMTGSDCQNRLSASLQTQQHRDIRKVLVKEECSLVLNEAQGVQGSSIRWNVEPVSVVNTPSPLMESGETTGHCRVTPDFNTNQCIFYPVKEEEREVLVGATQNNSGTLSAGSSRDAPQAEHQDTDSNLSAGCHSTEDHQEMTVRGRLSEPDSEFPGRQAETDAELPLSPDVRDFLLQSSDEEDAGGFELADPQIDSEAEVMAFFYKNQANSAKHADEASQNLQASTHLSQAPTEAQRRSREPIHYFTEYFGWDTWGESANCTNNLSSMSNPVTAKEVAQFVGIHIAMGTLKFPSLRLYWEDLTKVPLIAEAMPLSRFLTLSRTLKFASPSKDQSDSSVQETSHDSDVRQSEVCPSSAEQRHTTNDYLNSQTDPLWKVQPLLCRFKAGCQFLKRDGDYAVDQYPLPLTGKMHSRKLSLHCTTLIGFDGLLLHVDLKLGLSSKEDAVEKMVPKGSTLFLCKQELSTPAMLERLLVAGVHGAGRVGGARGQIGDEFVSSDGKLMLRRSHCGFILSTAGNGQRNMASLIDNFEKAQMSAHFNRDLLNLYSIPFTASAPTCWPQAVLWYLTDQALVNSWLLYRQDFRTTTAPLSLMAFRLEVSKSLIYSRSSDTQDSIPPQPPLEKVNTPHETPNPSLVEENPLPDAETRYDGSGHWPEQLAEGEGGRCRFGDCQRTSRVLCLKCCVFLCISRNHNCFLNFHNQV